MEKEGKIISCIDAPNMRQLITKANKLGIKKEEIVLFFKLGESIWLIYYN